MGYGLLPLFLVLQGSSGSYPETGLVELAKNTVRACATGSTIPSIRASRAAVPVFVTIEVDGKVRGCRGSLVPQTRSLEEEVQRAAQAAARFDPRYAPLRPQEASRLRVTVTLVRRLLPTGNVHNLTPDQGLVIRGKGRVGIVLPWEGRDPHVRLGWAYKKAGLSPGSPTQLQIMLADRYQG